MLQKAYELATVRYWGTKLGARRGRGYRRNIATLDVDGKPKSIFRGFKFTVGMKRKRLRLPCNCKNAVKRLQSKNYGCIVSF